MDDMCGDALFLLDNPTFPKDSRNLEQLLQISDLDGNAVSS